MKSITGLRGIVKGIQFTFTRGRDFDVDKDRNSVIWLTGGARPDEKTTFSVDYVVYTEISDTIIERLPGFYKAREMDSSVYELVCGFAKIVRDQERDVSRLGDSRSINSAYGRDLDLLASILGLARKRNETDTDFRSRIRSVVADIKLGGTVEAIRTQLASYLATSKDEFALVENPPTEMQSTKNVRSRDTWDISSESIADEEATIIISLEEGEAHDPALIDTDAKITLRFNGTLKRGDRLEIVHGKARLNGTDATSSLHIEFGGTPVTPTKDLPKISRKKSKWEFREKLTDTLARFDLSKFDESAFFKDTPPIRIDMKWTARLLATFEVRLPAKILERNSNLSMRDVEAFVSSVKAAGVRALVKIIPDSSQLDPLKVTTEKSNASPPIRRRGGL